MHKSKGLLYSGKMSSFFLRYTSVLTCSLFSSKEILCKLG